MKKKFKLVKHEIYEGMFFVRWPDGELSGDFYNETWASEHLRVLSRVGP